MTKPQCTCGQDPAFFRHHPDCPLRAWFDNKCAHPRKRLEPFDPAYTYTCPDCHNSWTEAAAPAELVAVHYECAGEHEWMPPENGRTCCSKCRAEKKAGMTEARMQEAMAQLFATMPLSGELNVETRKGFWSAIAEHAPWLLPERAPATPTFADGGKTWCSYCQVSNGKHRTGCPAEKS